MKEKINCNWQPITQYSYTHDEKPKTKLGRYHQSMFWDISNFGDKRWVIVGYLQTEGGFQKYLNEGMSIEDVGKACVAYLNEPIPRKKYQKKISVSKYGKLDFYRAILKKYDTLIVEIITNQRKNKYFWGEGPKA
jgi:hypothetical protein